MTGAARLIVVGCGHMGFAIVQGLLGRPEHHNLVLVESSPERRHYLLAEHRLSASADLEILESDAVVLAIPPQLFAGFAEAERTKFNPRTPVLSVMAGLTTATISEQLGTSQVVRAIPNTPSEVYQGMSVYFAGTGVREETIAIAAALLTSIGKVIRVDAEELVDDATAICGGGPAFVSYIVDAFCQFAASCGFTEVAGREMATQVFGGTAALLAESGKPPMQLCREVMTPSGTTERGIAAFDAAELKSSVLSALHASAQRSRELASSLSESAGGGEVDG